MPDNRCGIVYDSAVIFIPDDPVVERFVRRDLDALRPHIVWCSDDRIELTSVGLCMLAEYSASLPSGKADGKVWKCFVRPNGSEPYYILREYVDMGDPARWTIKDRLISVAEWSK